MSDAGGSFSAPVLLDLSNRLTGLRDEVERLRWEAPDSRELRSLCLMVEGAEELASTLYERALGENV